MQHGPVSARIVLSSSKRPGYQAFLLGLLGNDNEEQSGDDNNYNYSYNCKVLLLQLQLQL